MVGFDPRSFILVSALLGILCVIVLAILRRIFPKTIAGLTEWIWACGVMVVAAFLFAAPAALPVFFSSLMANLGVIAGIMLMHVSISRFAGQAPWYRSLLAAWLLAAALLVWFTLVDPNYQLRVALVTAINLTLFSSCALLIIRTLDNGLAERFTAIVFALTALMSLVRFVAAVGSHDGRVARDENLLLQTAYMASFAVSLVALTIGFMLMLGNRMHARLHYLASHDALSGAYSRGAFFGLLEQQLQQAGQHRQSLALLMIDLDNFKSINDRFGHPGGDRVLVDFVDRMKSALRASDLFGRYGGEEFAVLMPNTTLADAQQVAERIRANVASSSAPAYTVSIGISVVANGNQPGASLLTLADQALYLAKRNGKNQVQAMPENTSATVILAT